MPTRPFACLLVLTVLLSACASTPPAPPEPLGVAPSFAGVDSAGQPVALADYGGRVLVIDFWATWCHPCKASMPDMHALAGRYARDPSVAFLAIHTDETGDPARYFADNGYDMRLVPRGRDIAAEYGVYTLPTYLVIDPAGQIVFRYESQLTREVEWRMSRTIEAVRAEASE